MSDSDIERHVKQLVGIATLRRLRHMADGEAATAAAASRWARRLTFLFAAAAAIFVASLALKLAGH